MDRSCASLARGLLPRVFISHKLQKAYFQATLNIIIYLQSLARERRWIRFAAEVRRDLQTVVQQRAGITAKRGTWTKRELSGSSRSFCRHGRQNRARQRGAFHSNLLRRLLAFLKSRKPFCSAPAPCTVPTGERGRLLQREQHPAVQARRRRAGLPRRQDADCADGLAHRDCFPIKLGSRMADYARRSPYVLSGGRPLAGAARG